MTFDGKTVLVTGGTGSFGRKLIEVLLDRHDPAAMRVFSRDELKQSELRRDLDDERLRYLIGDVRDLPRLTRATRGVDVVVHAAALKQVPACEYNPFEAVQTNVVGAENVVSAAIENDVPLTMALSSDKAVNPVNLYGATKLCAEKIVTQGNTYAADSPSRVRQRPLRQRRRQPGQRHPALQGAGRSRRAHDHRRAHDPLLDHARAGGRVRDRLPRPDGRRRDLRPEDPEHARRRHREALAPDAEHRVIGIRPGEKIHEMLLTEDESRHSYRGRRTAT